MSKFRVGGLGVVVALTLLAPVVAGAAWVVRASSESPLESASEVAPLLGVVEPAQRSGELVVSIAVEFAEALTPTLYATGTVTAVPIGSGDVVQTGTRVATIDDRDVMAYTSDAPLWRDISRRAKGPDVAIAQQVLNDLGYSLGKADGIAGAATDRAIRRFNADHGYGTRNPVLSLASFVWVGTAPVTIDQMSVSLGDAVSGGTELFTTTAALAAITVTEPPTLDRDQEYVLVVGDAVIEYAVGSGAVTDAEAVVAIAAQLGTFREGVGTLRLANPGTVGTVPSSAVVTDERGVICMFPDVTAAPMAVVPLGGTLGVIDLDASLIGTSVLLNPREVRQDLTCGS